MYCVCEVSVCVCVTVRLSVSVYVCVCAFIVLYLTSAARHDAIVANFSATQPVTVANARIFAASGITGSVKFAQCKRFAQQYIVPLDYVVTNGTPHVTLHV